MTAFLSGYLAVGQAVAGAFVEETASDYLRMPITLPALAANATQPASAITLGPSSSAWGSVGAAAIYDAQTAGNELIWWPLDFISTIAIGMTLTLAPNDVALTFAGFSTLPAGATIWPKGAVIGTTAAGASVVTGGVVEYANGALSSAVASAPSGVTIPAAGMVGSNGSNLVAVGVGSGLSLASGVLSATESGGGSSTPLLPVTTAYTASGAIAVTDNLSLVNAASAVTMTLGASSTDGHELTVKRFGAGSVTLTATIDGAATSIVMNSASVKESISLTWNVANSTWLLL